MAVKSFTLQAQANNYSIFYSSKFSQKKFGAVLFCLLAISSTCRKRKKEVSRMEVSQLNVGRRLRVSKV
jgi:hypothetical protein